MLNDATCFKNIFIVTGYTDLRFGLDSLAAIIESKLGKNSIEPDTLYMFCGRRTDPHQMSGLGIRWLSAFIRIELLFEIISWKVQKLRLLRNLLE